MGELTVASSQNVRNLKYETVGDKAALAEGASCIHYILGFQIGQQKQTRRFQWAMDDAINNARKSGVDGDLLVNVRIKQYTFSFLLFSQDCIYVTGNLVKLETPK
ncbi:MAG: hypothetical protein LBO72_07955 [Helicobacteraceae bacterium]|nr:hypothetical protein [Helicobacteraceae bacterium]